MSDNTLHTPEPDGPSQAAGRVLENLAELEPELKGAVILNPAGDTIASTGSGSAWGPAAIELLAAVDAARETEIDNAHLATDLAEIFVVREGELVLIAVTARFVLASLTSFDMRMALRDVYKETRHA